MNWMALFENEIANLKVCTNSGDSDSFNNEIRYTADETTDHKFDQIMNELQSKDINLHCFYLNKEEEEEEEEKSVTSGTTTISVSSSYVDTMQTAVMAGVGTMAVEASRMVEQSNLPPVAAAPATLGIASASPMPPPSTPQPYHHPHQDDPGQCEVMAGVGTMVVEAPRMVKQSNLPPVAAAPATLGIASASPMPPPSTPQPYHHPHQDDPRQCEVMAGVGTMVVEAPRMVEQSNLPPVAAAPATLGIASASPMPPPSTPQPYHHPHQDISHPQISPCSHDESMVIFRW